MGWMYLDERGQRQKGRPAPAELHSDSASQEEKMDSNTNEHIMSVVAGGHHNRDPHVRTNTYAQHKQHTEYIYIVYTIIVQGENQGTKEVPPYPTHRRTRSL